MYRKILRYLIAAIFITQTASAQLPQAPEDIAPLLIGEPFPALTLNNEQGKPVDVRKTLSEKPAVIIFYRGGWCPYCNTHLAEIGFVEEEIIKAGYQVIAISPDAPEKLIATMDKNKLRYTLLSDAGGNLAKATGIAFAAPEKYGKMLSEYSNGANAGYLPVPSVFVVNKEGEIVFEYINPNYKKRISGALLLAVLKNL